MVRVLSSAVGWAISAFTRVCDALWARSQREGPSAHERAAPCPPADLELDIGGHAHARWRERSLCPPYRLEAARWLRGLMPLQEHARAVDGAGLQVRRLLPGKHRDLGIRRQRGDVDRD